MDATILTKDFIGSIIIFCEEMDEPSIYLEEEEEGEYWEDDYDECGYNPYLGCYDFDC